jgi:DNA polymerase-1
MLQCDRLDGGVASDSTHQVDHLVDDGRGERPAHDAVGSERFEAAGADADDLPADLAQRIVFVEIGCLFEAEVGAPGTARVVVFDGDAELGHEDVGPDLSTPVEGARDVHRVHAMVQSDAFAQHHPEPLLGHGGADSEAGLHERHARLDGRSRSSRIGPALRARRAGEHLAHRGRVAVVATETSPFVCGADPGLARERGAMRWRHLAEQLATRALGLMKEHAERTHPTDGHDSRLTGDSAVSAPEAHCDHGRAVRRSMEFMMSGPADTVVGDHQNGSVRIVVTMGERGLVRLLDPDRPDVLLAQVAIDRLADEVRELEASHPRWVWADTRGWYPRLLDAGVRLRRCHDLRLSAAILDRSTMTATARADGRHPHPEWLPAGPAEAAGTPTTAIPAPATHSTLFDFDGFDEFDGPATRIVPATRGEPEDESVVTVAGTGVTDAADATATDPLLLELARQEALVDGSSDPAALRLLLAAENAGALIGAEMHAAGVPWDRAVHEGVLSAELGARPAPGWKPERMEELAIRVREALGAASVNLDSQVDLLRALRNAGIQVDSTARWELREHEHPAIEPLIAYKKLARLMGANGWTWLDEWVADGRFRPEYVPGGTATGRWATSGGGALQLPKNVRSAVVADPGWTLVVADAAQLEPRVLAGMARDEAMATAGRGRDFYLGLVDAGVVATREEAKYAILGAMYGATTGESGRLVPRLARAFPRAMALVDRAAREGERGGSVTTLLGRSSPLPSTEWRAVQGRASEPDATAVDERRARSTARDWGRFTRNFVVQGSAAEWSLCWMATLRGRLDEIAARVSAATTSAAASGPVFGRSPHLVYFLHDEIIVHSPREVADEVAAAVEEAARGAGALLFGDFPVDFPLDLVIVDSYAMADA